MSTTDTPRTDEHSAVRYDRDADGIVTLTLDDPTASANTMNELYQASMQAAVERLYDEQDDVTGVVLASAKKTFFAGGNLKMMVKATAEDADACAARWDDDPLAQELMSYVDRSTVEVRRYLDLD